MLIDNGKQYRTIFREVVEDCIIGKITKEQAFMLLESRHKAELEKIRINEKNNPDVFHIIDRNGELHSVNKIRRPTHKDTEKEINLTELYKSHMKEFEDCFNDYKSEIEAIPEKQNPEPKQHIQNELVPKMIEKGVLSSDGKMPLKNINDVASFLVENGQFPTVATLKNFGLIKRDGKPYSDRAYEKAIDIANSIQRRKYT